MCAPKSDNGFGIDDVEFVLIARPLDDAAMVGSEQEIQKKFPKLKVTFICVWCMRMWWWDEFIKLGVCVCVRGVRVVCIV